jgi:hypothetical protein
MKLQRDRFGWLPWLRRAAPGTVFFVLLCAAAYGLRPASAQGAANGALALGGTDSYVTFGKAPLLGLSSFTLECWFRRTGPGLAAFTGNGGVEAIPLITKGRGEDDGSNLDMNYFLGIRAADKILVADFEDRESGLNHPIAGVTPLRDNTWYHAAVSYNGQKWQLFLNGVLEAELTVGRAARSDSVQHAALGAALDSTGAAEGFFDGRLDEARIWNYARPAQQIKDGMRQPITSAPGLVARWSLNEGSGTTVHDSAGKAINGTISGTSWAWSGGVAYTGNHTPATPVLTAPGNGAAGVSTAPTLGVSVNDPDGDNLLVTYYGKVAGTVGPAFSIIALPDTQYYSAGLFGGTPDIFKSQTQWITNHRADSNIVYVAHLGDCVEHGNNNGSTIEWDNAQAAIKTLENPVLTGLVEGIPYGIAVGNHDQSPEGDADGNSTKLYNQYFGTSRFYRRSYYGGHYGSRQDNHYQLFSAAGMDFIVIYLEYDETPEPAILKWADNLLRTYNTRRAIVVSHYLLDLNGTFGVQGQAIYDALKNNPNLFLMLCGHVPGESRRQDSFNGRTVQTLLADFQDLANGGDGWLRILDFSPASNQIRVRTYSPTLDLSDAGTDSQFTLSYDLQDSGFAIIKANPNAAAGSTSAIRWPGLRPNTEYEWYVTVSDGFATVTSPHWKFRTGN